jgi:hypothetical protein
MEKYQNKISSITSGENNPMFGKTMYDIWAKKYGIKEANNRRNLHIKNSTKSNRKGMTGRTVYSIWVEKYGIEEANKKLLEFRKKQSINSSGENNPMYNKSSPQGSGNGWKGWYKGWHFRSLRELSYMIMVIEKNNYKWENAEKRKYTIKYISYDNRKRTYRADFIVNNTIMVEIKPKRLHTSPLVLIKKKAGEEFCNKNGLKYELVDCEIPYKLIVDMYKNGMIILEERYKERFKQFIIKKEDSGD